MNKILITGCSRGIGYETCKLFYANRWEVFGTCTTNKGIKKLEEEFPLGTFTKCKFPKDLYFHLELPDDLNCLVNNVGIRKRYSETMEVNVDIPKELMRRTEDDCKIINVASIVEVSNKFTFSYFKYLVKKVIKKVVGRQDINENYLISKKALIKVSKKFREKGRDVNTIYS